MLTFEGVGFRRPQIREPALADHLRDLKFLKIGQGPGEAVEGDIIWKSV